MSILDLVRSGKEAYIKDEGTYYKLVPKNKGFEVFKKLNGKEEKISDSDEYFNKALAAYSSSNSISKKEYDEAN